MGFEMVRVGFDIIVLGGSSNKDVYDPKLFKLSCTNDICQWETLAQKLQTPRRFFVAIPIQDDFVKCD